MIADFWTRRLAAVKRPSTPPIQPGWSVQDTPNPSFIEADLRLREGYDDLTAPIWFVAAPGAVGKSTLAKEISARTGAVYVDLARANKVGGNFVAGGLVNNQLYAAWIQDQTAILIDALDEGRLGVTQSSFEDFLIDAKLQTHDRILPVVIFGRVGIVDEAWLILSDNQLNCPIFDIQFFDTKCSKQFVMSALDRRANDPEKQDDREIQELRKNLPRFRKAYQKAAEDFVQALEDAAAADGPRFAGYAPVLDAIAALLSKVTNPAGLEAAVRDVIHDQVLPHLADVILKREALKFREQLSPLLSAPDSVKEQLYEPDEQLARLSEVIYQTAAPRPAVTLPAADVAKYEAEVKTFLPNHPFLDGTGRGPSSTVFAAVINAHALFSRSSSMAAAAERHAGNGPHTPNPFLIDFYLDLAQRTWGENPIVPPEHVVALYESVRARALPDEVVRLTIEGDENDDVADVEIQIAGAGAHGADRQILFRTSQAGELRFGRQVTGVSVDTPHLDLVIGSGNPVEMIAPGTLNVAGLKFECPELVVLRTDPAGDGEDVAFTVEARELLGSTLTSVPLVRNGAELWVSWPGANAHPWSNFIGTVMDAPEIDDALRGLRRLVLAFRSHKRGRLARIRDKIEHRRITKGDLGVAIRRRLMADGVLSLEGSMYFLNPDILGRVVGATYQDLKLKRFSARVQAYASSITV